MATTEGNERRSDGLIFAETVPIFKKRKSSAIRKRNDNDDDGFSTANIVKSAKVTKDNPLMQSTAREAKGLDLSYASSRTAAALGSEDAHATAINVLAAEENEQIRTKALPVSGDGIYRGMKGYKDYEPKTQQAGSIPSGGTSAGPLKAPVFIRQATRFDYQPDLCKDYKETGFCGFGGMCESYLVDKLLIPQQIPANLSMIAVIIRQDGN